MSRYDDSMYCKGCGYTLRGLEGARRADGRATCPECGREFGPEDPRTWNYFRARHAEREGRVPGWMVMLGVMVAWVAFVMVMKTIL